MFKVRQLGVEAYRLFYQRMLATPKSAAPPAQMSCGFAAPVCVYSRPSRQARACAFAGDIPVVQRPWRAGDLSRPWPAGGVFTAEHSSLGLGFARFCQSHRARLGLPA